VKVTMVIRTAQLRHTIDPTMAVEQSGVARQFVSDASGWLTVTPRNRGASSLRVPVYGAAKPVSATTVRNWGNGSQGALLLSGKGVEQGSGASAFASLVSVLDLGATSPKLPKCRGDRITGCTVNETAVAGDLEYVGAGATKSGAGYADGWLYFGIATYGDWATVGNSTIPYVDFDTTGDGVPDYEVYVQNLPSTDVLVAILVDLNAGAVADIEPVNLNFGDVDTNVFDTNVLLIPVWPSAIGITDDTESFPITYTVGTNSPYTNNASGDIDQVGPVSFDAVNPSVQVADPLYLDQGYTAIPYRLADADAGSSLLTATSNGRGKHRPPHPGHGHGTTAKALVLHLHGASGHRAQVVTLGR